MIPVTKTYLPDKAKYQRYIDEIYVNGWVTNGGPLVQKLEKRLAEYLGVKNIVLVANGTVALEIAYRALGISGFVVTTPFSFVATTSSLVTNGLLPIFSDIDPLTYNIDPNHIEEAITPNTSAILGVHVFGNACEVETIEHIAKKHRLKVIYDAAHAFGVQYKGQSLLNYGDISTLSFHATKLFHTIEGGALIINDDTLVQKARYLINFGIEDTESIPELGTNAKMNEFEAAMGLCLLDDLELIREKRASVENIYQNELKDIVQFQKRNLHASQNFSYFPIVLKSENELKTIQTALNAQDIFPRRYFYPSLDTLKYIEPKQYCPIARDIAKRILCLPMYADLESADQDRICKIVQSTLKFLNGAE
ncbi:MAG: DegT/DnrJ/EryC1/StrS family aminotransferase [Sulfuricurvum sp.]|uniref:DegT/DnrJ/EryC1/StrS family aminotransferase n=1 Tax=Sulfuricurvum sp. TaxID=2025608 RepID=UPI00261A34E9|nr:DegT/DnrJ/EryC1/StrS family aminotransferase [Sulfuricurvum sp.]MDD2367683.1 DegT/DnrJ/EryC1/StrS family aminotransferase [Sulfuricurvum sp.]MDD2950099.1 DegT/DnrJ/EryC1/StrS family aminotransferase [Sulfuricurvum sp.]MDD5118608.1 DegT/DnrJ/EryC1/StrS family aminotransferase [Sulfuricurvum sp.]